MKRTLLLLALLFLVSNATLAQVPSYVPSNGLVGWWPFNGNANDESGNGNNGTVNGATLTSDRYNAPNSCFSFSSNPSEITISNYFFDNGWLQNTVSLWFNPSSSNLGNGCLINTIPHDGFGLGYSNYGTNQKLYYSKNSDPNQHLWDIIGGNIGNNDFNYPAFNLGTWYHIAIVKNNNTYFYYVNGVLDRIVSSVITPISYLCGLNFGNISPYPAHPSELFKGKLDDIGIWNRALDSCEVKDLYYASLGNCCQASFNSQPQNQNVSNGAIASFIAQSSSANPSYQWQSDLGLGWQNLSNAGQYNGVNNDTLTVTNLSAANNNQLFRCILTSGTCSDTSAAATLNVSQTNGLNTLQNEIISIYPNPATNQINIVSNAAHYPLSYKVYNELGQALLIGDLKTTTTSIDISSLAPGNYMLVVGTKHVGFVKNK